MTVQIIQDFIPSGRRNRPGYKLTPKYITIHDTANTQAGADAKAHAAYLKKNPPASEASWHFTVDDKVIYQHLPLNENGWHASDGTNGPGNRKSIAIEICVNRDGNLAKAEANAAWLAAKLIKEVNTLKPFPACMKQHYDWSKKNCPAQIRGRKNGWANFLAAVEAHLKTEAEITRTISIYVGGKKVDEVGYLINNSTYVKAAYLIELTGGQVTGHGDHIKIVLPAKTDPAEIAKLKAEINGLKAANAALEARIENARIALS